MNKYKNVTGFCCSSLRTITTRSAVSISESAEPAGYVKTWSMISDGSLSNSSIIRINGFFNIPVLFLNSSNHSSQLFIGPVSIFNSSRITECHRLKNIDEWLSVSEGVNACIDRPETIKESL